MVNEITDRAISDINERLDWANRIFEKLKSNKTNQIEVQDNVWSFLDAFQRSWYYYNRFILEVTPVLSKKERETLSKKIINNWKDSQLTNSDRLSWDLLQSLRNQDTHRDPVHANYNVRLVRLMDFDGAILTDYDGTPLCGNVDGIYVQYKEEEYDFEHLADCGIKCIKQLIEYIPEIKTNVFR